VSLSYGLSTDHCRYEYSALCIDHCSTSHLIHQCSTSHLIHYCPTLGPTSCPIHHSPTSCLIHHSPTSCPIHHCSTSHLIHRCPTSQLLHHCPTFMQYTCLYVHTYVRTCICCLHLCLCIYSLNLRKMADVLGFQQFKEDTREAIQVELFLTAYSFCIEEGFASGQISAFLTLLHMLLLNCKGLYACMLLMYGCTHMHK
jgi:hypothetical protein